MTTENRIPKKRKINMLFLLLEILALVVFFFFRYFQTVDILILNVFIVTLCFFFLIEFVFEKRIHKEVNNSYSTDYKYLNFSVLLFVIFVAIYSFMPKFTLPVIVLMFFLTETSGEKVSLVMGSFLVAIYALNKDMVSEEIVCYIILIAVSTVFIPMFQNKKNRLYALISLFCYSFIFPVICSYIYYGKINYIVLVLGIINGVSINLIFYFAFDRINRIAVDYEDFSYDKILSENYPIQKEIKNFSKGDFIHAQNVSALCGKVAEFLGIDVKLCMAGGFYYRVGVLSGEPIIENGVTMAEELCFPEELINIIAEYNGEEKAISSKESAIVHIINTLISRFEHLREETENSEWNREIIIMQTMNDKSSEGLYDNSGLSINEFLKLREFLVRGDDL